MEQFIWDSIRILVGEDGLNKSQVVIARAATIAGHDNTVDLGSLLLGLWIGNDGDMPENLDYEIMGMLVILTKKQMDNVAIPMNDMD
jgi:hypothetical protein